MNTIQNIIITASAILATLSWFDHGVEGAAWGSVGIECLGEAPEVCFVRASFTSPSPTQLCYDDTLVNCVTSYSGGWSWNYQIAEDLPDGVDTDIDVALEAAGLDVNVDLDDDGVTCTVSVSGEPCASCSIEGCGDPDFDWSASIRYDCTNLNGGRSSGGDCHALRDPFLYPFLLETPRETTTTTAPLDGEDASISNDTIAPDSSDAAAAAEPSDPNGRSPDSDADATADTRDAPDSNMAEDKTEPARSAVAPRRKRSTVVGYSLIIVLVLMFVFCHVAMPVSRKEKPDDDFLEEKPDDTEKPDYDSENQLDDDASEQA